MKDMPEATRIDAGENIRVLHVFRKIHPAGGGVQTYVASVVAALEDAPVTLGLGALGAGRTPLFKCDVRHMGHQHAGKIKNLVDFWRWLKRDLPNFDVVHIHHVFGLHFVLTALICRTRKIPYLVSPHGRLVPESIRSMRFRHKLYLRLVIMPLLRRAAAVVVTTEGNTTSLGRLDPRLCTAVVSPGLTVTRPAEPRPEPGPGLRIGFVGRLSPVKGLPTLFHAMGSLARRGINVQADIVGGSVGTHGHDLENLARELGIRNSVIFHGAVRGAMKDDIIQRAHVVAVPSEWENFSFATAEALALGVPVVVSKTVGLAPVVERYGCGSVVPAGNSDAWADALALYMDPARRRAASGQALLCAQAEFSLAAMGKALLHTYRSALENRLGQ